MLEYRIVSYAPNYRVGADGSVWSRRNKIGNRWVDGEWREMNAAVHHDGYRYVTLYCDGKARSRKVSVLVCEAFHGPRPAKMEACHDNGIRTDDRQDNLYWGTRKKNADDRDRHGRTARGERNGWAKLADAQRAELIDLRGTISQEAAGKRFGICQVSVGRIWRGSRKRVAPIQ